MITFRVPVPPSVNNAFRNTSEAERARAALRGGKTIGARVKTKHYKEWQNAAGWAINIQRVPPVTGDVAIFIECPLPKNRDCDNVLKLLLDLLVYMHILKDDSQVDDLHIIRKVGEGHATVTIRKIT